MKDADSEPPENVLHTKPVTISVGVDVGVTTEPHVSVVANPLPVRVTTVPAGPELGTSITVAFVTVKVNVAESPVRPRTLTMCGPRAALAETVNEAPNTPLEIVQDGKVTMSGSGVLEIVHEPVSPGEKLIPDTVTTVPATPDAGIRVIDGGVTVPTVKPAVAIAPAPLFTWTV